MHDVHASYDIRDGALMQAKWPARHLVRRSFQATATDASETTNTKMLMCVLFILVND